MLNTNGDSSLILTLRGFITLLNFQDELGKNEYSPLSKSKEIVNLLSSIDILNLL